MGKSSSPSQVPGCVQKLNWQKQADRRKTVQMYLM